MAFTEWIPTDWKPWLTSTAVATAAASTLFAAAVYLARNLITTRLTKAVEAEFNKELEQLRSRLRNSEEQLKADLRIKESEILALRASVLNTMATRQIALDKRRIEAVEQVWSAVTALTPARFMSGLLAQFNLGEVTKAATTDPKWRELFTRIGAGCDLKQLNTVNAHNARPFVSPMVWAVFSAYSSIAMGAAIRLEGLKAGLDTDLVNHESTKKLIKAALPHQSEYVEKFGQAGHHWLLEELQEKLLSEINTMLTGKDSDKSSLDQAAKILKATHELQTENEKAKVTGSPSAKS